MLLAMGLIGCWLDRIWGCMLLAVALGITVYWPVVCLATVVGARDAADWNLTAEAAYWVVLPLFVLWGAWGLWCLVRLDENRH